VNTLLANDFWPSRTSYYTGAVADLWKPAVLVFGAGIVVSLLGRVLGRR